MWLWTIELLILFPFFIYIYLGGEREIPSRTWDSGTTTALSQLLCSQMLGLTDAMLFEARVLQGCSGGHVEPGIEPGINACSVIPVQCPAP